MIAVHVSGLNLAAFLKGQDGVGWNVPQPVHLAARPSDFDLVGRAMRAETKMNARVVAREIALARAHGRVLRQLTRPDHHPRADSVAVAARAGGLDCYPVVPAIRDVLEQRWRRVDIAVNDV